MLAPLIAWNLTGVPSRPLALTIDGLDVLAGPPGLATYHVDPRSVHVKESGPGQVSSLDFVITDPLAEINVAPAMFVRFDNRTLNLPIFAGWVESWSSVRKGLGRLITVTCIGVEAWLDWAYVPAMTIATGTDINAGFQAILSAATGLSLPLRWFSDGSGLSSVASPIAAVGAGVCTFDVAIPAGTARRALQALGDAVSAMSDISTDVWAFTVDFYFGIRVWTWSADGGFNIVDYANPDIRTTGAHPRPSGTQYGVNGSGTPRIAFVTGGASPGYVTDGTGLPGPVAVVNNVNASTPDRRQSIGRSYLSNRGISVSGQVTVEGGITLGTFGAQNRAGAFMFVNDPQAGMSSIVPQFIQSIEKDWAASLEETWTFHFGATVPRAAAYLRALTSGQQI